MGAIAGSATGIRVGALLEELSVEAQAQNSAFARMISAIKLCGRNSFPAGTPVLLADGSRKPIEDIHVGDRVLSTDPVSGTTEAEPVTGVIAGTGAKHLVDVTIQAGDATATVTATDGHPFWVADRAAWVDAVDLHAGQWLRTGTGTWVQVAGVRHRTATTKVRNFAVARHHTYYVAAAGSSVLVHNGCQDYQWAPVPASLDSLPEALRWSPSQGIPVIGRWPDNAIAGKWPGHTYFNIPLEEWKKDPTKNDAWVQSIVDQRGTVYVGSPTQGNYWHNERKEPSTFMREIQQLLDNGYEWKGDYLVPPPR